MTPIQFFCPRWGSENLSWPAFCTRVKDAGYDGIECGISNSANRAELDAAFNAIEQHRLQVIIQHYETNDADFSRHYDQFNQWLVQMSSYPHQKINSQTGRDIFTFDQNCLLLDLGNSFAACHETHRGKALFAAHIAKQFLEQKPIKLTLDISHWVCVAESWLHDQKEVVNLAINATEHLHARIGFPEGPQIGDPRAPEWQEALNHHLTWWDGIVALKANNNQMLTITTEFGPYPYMQEVPITRKPLADQWAVNEYMLHLLQNRYL